MDNSSTSTSSGIPSLVSSAVALLSLLAGLHPTWAVVGALSQHSAELTQILATVFGAVGVIGAAIAHPPAWLRTPIVSAWQRLRGVTPKATP